MKLVTPETQLALWRTGYRELLTQNILPFWLQRGIDREWGGISNVLSDEGSAISHDKFLWSQGRALWTFSAAHNRIETRPEWLEFADHIFSYLKEHGRDDQGRWMYRLDQYGNIQDRDTSIYVDGFVIAGCTEYFTATQNSKALEIARATWTNVQERLGHPGSYGVAPYDIPAGLKTHGIAMLFSFFGYNLAEVRGEERIRLEAMELANQILTDFYVPKADAILEYVTLEGDFSDTPAGRACVPGHAIEALWFLISIFERSGHTELIPNCCRLIKRHLELGWDETFGGLRLALDIMGHEPGYWRQPDFKPWWVQVEALVATALAYVHCREDWCLEWHERVRSWAFAHYPLPAGEWRQWLTRDGQPGPSAALPVKDPFHLPRALIYLDEILGRPL